MPKSDEDQIREAQKRAAGGDERDSQGDGVADAAAELRDRHAGDPQDRQQFAQPGTNNEPVPGGIEGSIMEGEENDRIPTAPQTHPHRIPRRRR